MDGKIKRVAPLPAPSPKWLSARCFLKGSRQLVAMRERRLNRFIV
jgi:hypothetical protein